MTGRRKIEPPTAVIEAHPARLAWCAERDDLRAQRATLNAQAAQLRAQRDKAAADYEAKVRAAVQAREPVPTPPPRPDFAGLDQASEVLRFAEREHAERERQALATIVADGGIPLCRERLEQTVAAAAEPVRAAEAALADVRETLRTWAKLARAVELGDGVSANALEARAARLVLDDLVVSVATGAAIETAPVVVDGLVQPVTAEDEELAAVARQRLDHTLRRREAAVWSARGGLIIERDPVGAFADGSAHRAGQPQLGRRVE